MGKGVLAAPCLGEDGRLSQASGLAHSPVGHGTHPGLFLVARVPGSRVRMVSKPPSYLHTLPPETKQHGKAAAGLAVALMLILSQHLQPFAHPPAAPPRPPLPPLQLRQLRNSRGRGRDSSGVCHEDVLLAHCSDALPALQG